MFRARSVFSPRGGRLFSLFGFALVKLKRVIRGGFIVAAVLGLLCLPFLQPPAKVQAVFPRGKLAANAPVFGYRTKYGIILRAVTLPLSNVGPVKFGVLHGVV